MAEHQPRMYQEALGIHVGDIVRTSYGSGPYEVWSIFPPSYTEDRCGLELIVRLWPVVSLACVSVGGKPHYAAEDTPYIWFNDVRQAIQPGGTSRWFTDQNDEVLVAPATLLPAQLDMFASYLLPMPEPPCWTAGVDYEPRGDGMLRLWECKRCKLHFNGEPITQRAHIAVCPTCQRTSGRPIYVMPREAGISSLMLALDHGIFDRWQPRRPRQDERAVGEVGAPWLVSTRTA